MTKCVLVGDGRLGGISQTLCAFEALEKRHYQVDSLVLFASEEQTNKYGNEQYLQSRFHCDPEVRRIPFDLLGSATQGELPSEFFDHPGFLQVYNDLLVSPETKDKRTLLEKPQHFSELEWMQIEELQDWLGLERFYFAQ
ncbi:hypothetical protein BASA81_006637 [Batrachochytrium salamandrivorans]|nr:hypothetical protein BASA81_006637 [Batrachochytrium salamandrivorans]